MKGKACERREEVSEDVTNALSLTTSTIRNL
jgi:hypothetical protein